MEREHVMRADRLTVAVDFDGVIMKFTGWKGKFVFDEAISGASTFLKALSSEYRVVIMTARPDIAEVWSWLAERNLSQWVDEITNQKVPAFVYIDDRAVQFNGNFFETMRTIAKFKPWWADTEKEK